MHMTLCIVPPQDRIQTPRRLRQTFKAYAIEACSRNYSNLEKVYIREALSSFHVHHIIPRMLGGKDDYDNLVLIEPSAHFNLHKVIEYQLRGAVIGDKVTVNLPMGSSKVWGLTPGSVVGMIHLAPRKRDFLHRLLEQRPIAMELING